MKQKVLLIFLSAALCDSVDTNSLKLKQVLIFSRHNIRSPVGTELPKFSAKQWPKRNGTPGHLTRKGVRLEGYMGEYFYEWFKSEKLFTEECPCEDEVYVYANSINRTIATAKAFLKSAFRCCNIIVNHKITDKLEEMDPTFMPVIHNTTEAYKNMVISEINRKLRNSKLNAALLELNKILDINKSEICETESICDLTDISKNKITYEVGTELWVNGPLYIGNTVLDTFLMNYYDGLPLEDVAWGLVRTPEKWEAITEIGRQDQNIRYTTLAKDIGAPMLKYLVTTFLNYDNMPKLMLIVGHDFNQNPLFYSLGFKPIRLPNHYELFPIGGKIVFQRWTDNKHDYLKIEYVYPSWNQLRNISKFSMEKPPQRVLLELNWCNMDKNGFCQWEAFINKLTHL